MKTTEFIKENASIAQEAVMPTVEAAIAILRGRLHNIAVNSVDIHTLLRKLNVSNSNYVIASYDKSIKEAESLIQHVLEQIEYETDDLVSEMESFNPAIAEAKFVEATDTVEKDKEGNVTSWQHTGDWKKSKKDKIVDKSGAVHTPASRARDLARTATPKNIAEEASGGATMSSTIAVTPATLGEKGAFSKKEVNKKLGAYSNMLTRGGPVTVKKTT